MADSFEAKRKAGTAQQRGSGFGGSGFKFDASEDNAVKAYKKVRGKCWWWRAGGGRPLAADAAHPCWIRR